MNFELLAEIPLFKGMKPAELENVLRSISSLTKKFTKDEVIYHAGDHIKELGIVIFGSVQIENIDILGNKSILGIAQTGDVFAESYACIPDQPLMVDVIAREASEILFINVLRMMQDTSSDYSNIIIRNLLRISSRKNQALSMRIFHSSPKTIRARVVSYFSEQVTCQGTNDITIPLDRQQLADYLGVDRTALSKELSKMKSDGLIDYHKNKFRIMV